MGFLFFGGMMDLIKIDRQTIGRHEVDTVDGRELHTFLEVQTRFDKWLTRRIEEYGFVINSDFCPILTESSGGRPATEYILSIDMAKELCMVERTEKGKQARTYFIECERQLKSIRNGEAPTPPTDDVTRLLDAALDGARKLVQDAVTLATNVEIAVNTAKGAIEAARRENAIIAARVSKTEHAIAAIQHEQRVRAIQLSEYKDQCSDLENHITAGESPTPTKHRTIKQQIFTLLDTMRNRLGHVPARADALREACINGQFNPSTTTVYFAEWKRANARSVDINTSARQSDFHFWEGSQ